MSLRPAEPGDAADLARILGDWIAEVPWLPKLHSREEDLAFLRELLQTHEVTVWGRPATGFLARRGEEITALHVAAEARDAGVGSALMAAAKAASPILRLWVFQANTPALRFYARQGFVETEHGDGSGNEEGLPDLALNWTRHD